MNKYYSPIPTRYLYSRSSSYLIRSKIKGESPLCRPWRDVTFTKGKMKVWIDETRKR